MHLIPYMFSSFFCLGPRQKKAVKCVKIIQGRENPIAIHWLIEETFLLHYKIHNLVREISFYTGVADLELYLDWINLFNLAI